MRWWRGLVIGVLVGALIGGVFLLGYVLGKRHEQRAEAGADFDVLWTVRNLLQANFIGEIPSAQAQVYGAAHGLTAAFNDPYTVFVEPAPRQIERDELAGHFGGIGAYMSRDDAGDVIVTVMRDRPAAQAGIQDGDVLLEVDGKPITKEMKIEDIVALVRGEVGSKVKLKLRHADQSEPFTVDVVRERIDTPSVEWRVLDKGKHIGYVRISIFGEQTAQELQTGLTELAGQGVDKLIFDLRGNGGGLVDAAIDTASQFLKDGVVLREIKRGGQERFYPVKPAKSPAQDWKIALLVDGGTASAAEIVAGALQDQGRAILVGEKTYGKGSVQEVHELPDGSSLHVTVARWLTPDRHQIDKTGLAPDVQVNITDEDRSAGRDPQLSRAQAWLAGER